MKSDRMRNKEKCNKTEKRTECERFALPLKATASHTFMVIFTTDIIEMKLFLFKTIHHEYTQPVYSLTVMWRTVKCALVINHNSHHPAAKKQAFKTEMRSWPPVFYN